MAVLSRSETLGRLFVAIGGLLVLVLTLALVVPPLSTGQAIATVLNWRPAGF
ncbi:hypothetical protein KHQ08_11755 [Pseudochrobactrum algeriensis]|uniref:hypothetical protein n=1 Tax=Pseudochrobactrum algeriensis TaxID=2834768 RepID=UPI001BD11E87|nr:hypothetical protein [Pseudochrobactrum algeriensis]QVQ35876.1 hypothetical protein KHQ08_11755 [Pseudochrobactrum algeriensis]